MSFQNSNPSWTFDTKDLQGQKTFFSDIVHATLLPPKSSVLQQHTVIFFVINLGTSDTSLHNDSPVPFQIINLPNGCCS